MKQQRCAIYTRKSHEEGLDQEYNSLDAQRDACEAFIMSQAHEGWKLVRKHYDDGGFSGGTLDRPALKELLEDVRDGNVDVIVVYKIDRLTRSLMDFSKIMDVLDTVEASFAAVTQHFNTTTSMGRLTLNVLLSFAQFEREVTGERIRDKIAASKKKGMWTGGPPMLGYDIVDKKLVVNEKEARAVRRIFERYLEIGNVTDLVAELGNSNLRTKRWTSKTGKTHGGFRLTRGPLYKILKNPIYLGKVRFKDATYEGQHEPIISEDLWTQVQDQLASNRRSIKETRANDDARFLKGRIFDSTGNRMSPTYAVKNGNTRYPYYVSAPIVGNRKVSVGEIARVPAQALETLVLDRLKTICNMDSTDNVQKASVDSVIQRVTVYKDSIEMEVDSGASNVNVKRLKSSEDEIVNKNGSTLIRIQVTLHKWSRQLALVSNNGTPAIQSNDPDPILIQNIVRAHKWREGLESGQIASIQEIAAQDKLGERYVRKLLPLAYLAPDIIESLLDGNQLAGNALKKLIQTKIPLSWNKQREALGLAS